MKNKSPSSSQELLSQLIQAIKDGNIPKVNELIDEGVDINAKKDHHELSPLLIAMAKKNVEIMKLLIEAGANINEESPGDSLLYYAIDLGTPIVKLLLESGAAIPPSLTPVSELIGSLFDSAKHADKIINNQTSGPIPNNCNLKVVRERFKSALEDLFSQFSDNDKVEDLTKGMNQAMQLFQRIQDSKLSVTSAVPSLKIQAFIQILNSGNEKLLQQLGQYANLVKEIKNSTQSDLIELLTYPHNNDVDSELSGDTFDTAD